MLRWLFGFVKFLVLSALVWFLLLLGIGTLSAEMQSRYPNMNPMAPHMLALSAVASMTFVFVIFLAVDLEERIVNTFKRGTTDRQKLNYLLETLAFGGKVEVVTRPDGKWARMTVGTELREIRMD